MFHLRFWHNRQIYRSKTVANIKISLSLDKMDKMIHVYMDKMAHKIGYKWSTTHRELKSYKSKMGVIYMQSIKQCVLPFITTLALWQLMLLGTWCAWCTSIQSFFNGARVDKMVGARSMLNVRKSFHGGLISTKLWKIRQNFR